MGTALAMKITVNQAGKQEDLPGSLIRALSGNPIPIEDAKTNTGTLIKKGDGDSNYYSGVFYKYKKESQVEVLIGDEFEFSLKELEENESLLEARIPFVLARSRPLIVLGKTTGYRLIESHLNEILKSIEDELDGKSTIVLEHLVSYKKAARFIVKNAGTLKSFSYLLPSSNVQFPQIDGIGSTAFLAGESDLEVEVTIRSTSRGKAIEQSVIPEKLEGFLDAIEESPDSKMKAKSVGGAKHVLKMGKMREEYDENKPISDILTSLIEIADCFAEELDKLNED